MAALMALAIATGFAWLAIPAALATVALAAGALVLELRARRDADVMLHAAPLTAPARDAETSAVLAQRAAALTAPKHLRALAAAVRGYAHGRPHLLVPQPPAASAPLPPYRGGRSDRRRRSSARRPTPAPSSSSNGCCPIRGLPRTGSGASSGSSPPDLA